MFNLADLFEAVVDRAGDREALVAGDRRLSFARLDERANRMAHLLASLGVGVGDRVGIALANGPEHVEALLGAYKIRAAPFNVNYRYTTAEMAYLFNDARPRVVLHDAGSGSAIAAAVDACGSGGQPTMSLDGAGPAHESRLEAMSTARPATAGRSGDDDYLLYTGGTTGMPKGVEWRHEDIFLAALRGSAVVSASGADGALEAVDAASTVATMAASPIRVVPASPMVHGTAQWATLTTLLSGGTVLTLESSAFSATELWDVVDVEHANLVVIVGDAFARPLADALVDHPDRWGFDSLVAVVSGGAPLSPSVRTDLGQLLPWAAIVDGYGTSETGGQGNAVTWPGQAATPATRFPLSAHTAVLDEDGTPLIASVHAGRIGMIARTGHIPRGYRNDPQRTAETFPVIGGRRWAIPGDLGRVEDDGTVTLLGRGATSINTGGEKVFPDEVEAVLKAHPGVFDAAVVGVPDPRWGERVVAVVAPRAHLVVSEADVEAYCRARLAAFKVPRHMIVVDSIRRLPSGKADQAWVRSVAAPTSDASDAPPTTSDGGSAIPRLDDPARR